MRDEHRCADVHSHYATLYCNDMNICAQAIEQCTMYDVRWIVLPTFTVPWAVSNIFAFTFHFGWNLRKLYSLKAGITLDPQIPIPYPLLPFVLT